MAKLIPGVKLTAAKNAQFDEYMRDVLENAQVCPGILTYLPQDLAAFRSASEALHAMVARPLRWELTPAITEADGELDKALSALRMLMKAMLVNPDPDVAEAAKVVLRMSEIDKITGQEQYDEESGKISAMITTLTGDYAQQTEAAGLMAYVLQLKQRNERLCQLLQERDLAQGEAGPHNATELRATTDSVYRRLVLDVNSVSNCIDLGIVQPSAALLAQSEEQARQALAKAVYATPAVRALEREAAANPFAVFIDYMIGHIDRFHREVLKTSSSNTPAMDGDNNTGETTNPTDPSNPGNNTPGGGENNTPGGGGNTEDNRQEYQITYMDANNEDEFDIQMVKEGDPIVPPTPPTGYHWVDVPEVMPARNIYIRCAANA